MVLEQFHAPLRWQDVPDPEIGPGDVLIRVVANGLCATDLKIADGRTSCGAPSSSARTG
jgi:D-arabinose 1-dehydrogenase-like Zn-dependent alcohol dehydrogenase